VRVESAVFPRVEGVDVKELPHIRGYYVVDVNAQLIYVFIAIYKYSYSFLESSTEYNTKYNNTLHI
jgi:hypothetical protein